MIEPRCCPAGVVPIIQLCVNELATVSDEDGVDCTDDDSDGSELSMVCGEDSSSPFESEEVEVVEDGEDVEEDEEAEGVCSLCL